ncbi:MAG: hypothetical protein ACLFRW_00805 [Halorhodospira sp.]
MSDHRLRLRVPGLLGPLPGPLPPGVLAPQPGLETWLARGRAGALEPVAAPEAIGPLSWLADGGVPGDRYWARALPLHLRAESSGLRLVTLALEEQEVAHLETDLADLLAAHELRLHRASTGRWYLESEAPLPERPAPERINGRLIDAALPRDREALAWAAVFNEIEMALYDHPVNRARAERGEPPVNALWAWGSARQPAPPGGFPWQRVLSDDPAWQGLALLAGATTGELAGATPIAPGPRTLVVVPWAEHALAAADGAAWIDAVSAVERAFAAPALTALTSGSPEGGRWEVLELCPENDHEGVVLTRRSLRRFWRRRRPLRDWVREGEADA